MENEREVYTALKKFKMKEATVLKLQELKEFVFDELSIHEILDRTITQFYYRKVNLGEE